ncbi:MAG TPA: hypothetical protein DD723_09795 [Candidatus Omnitrophica bacterium]|nr:MAG: hypothetical protein A2Z81_03580 [Omnitrophica WOR_2 bacterium GWA2_45_18]HBR15811.1 hypothetical protein [Candidatus Omnitrophota bacterium]
MIKLTKKQAMEYEKKWRRVNLIKTKELQTVSMEVKFKQLCLLMNSFPFSAGQKREKELLEVRKRWKILKRKCGQDGR